MLSKELLKQNFLCPSDEYTPIPFWFWNDMLREEKIKRQIHDFRDKGVMGFVIHPRKGLPKEIPYLSDRYMYFVKYAVEEAAKLQMKVVLYDEAMYPSGSAHGKVVEHNPEYASRCLRIEEMPWQGKGLQSPNISESEEIIAAVAMRVLSDAENKYKAESGINIFPVDGQYYLDVPAAEKWCVFFMITGYSGGTIRGVHKGEDDGEDWAPKAADLLNPAAVDTFITYTHERYYQVLRDYFGSTIIAMFTDEPDLLGRCHKEGSRPWTTGFLEYYTENGGCEKDLPGLWFDIGVRTESVRKTFNLAVSRKMRQVYYGKLSEWCTAHDIALTGHPQTSHDIGLLDSFQIPGQDVVWRVVAPEEDKGIGSYDSVMAKCSSDAARHRGYLRNANECFGCCGPNGIHWAFSMDDMKWYMDWLFVRGVNLLYPHAFYYSLEGRIRYGERPPDVGLNNIWWKYYLQISTYIKRLSWLMTGSCNVTPAAVLCEESYLPWESIKSFYQNQIEFNYLEKELLCSEKCKIENGKIYIQKQQYRYLIIEDEKMITEELQEKINEFCKDGGIVVYASTQEYNILERDAVLYPANPDLRVSHVVKEGFHFYMLVNEGEEIISGELQLPVQGSYEIWNPWTGLITAVPNSGKDKNHSSINITLQRRESLIICIDPSAEACDIGKINNIESSEKKVFTIDNKWLIERNGQKIAANLESWTNWEDMKHVTDTVWYETEVSLHVKNNTTIQLDLGEVHEIAHVYVNGNDCGCCMWAPYVFDISAHVQNGSNVIKVGVTNTMANRLEEAMLPSGLIGPVIINLMR